MLNIFMILRFTILYCHVYVSNGVLLKGVVESSLIVEDELLTPHIDRTTYASSNFLRCVQVFSGSRKCKVDLEHC